jgi:hypothetical protein
VGLFGALLLAGCTSPFASRPSTSAPRIAGWLHTTGTQIVDTAGHPIRLVGVNVTDLQSGFGVRAERMPGKPLCFGWRAVPGKAASQIWDWGFNMVRLPIAWADLEPLPPVQLPDGAVRHWYNRQYLAALDDAVTAFGNRGISVLIDMHQFQWSPAYTRVSPENVQNCPGQGMPKWLYPTGIKTLRSAKASFFSNQDDVQALFAQAWQEVAGRYAHNATVIGFDLLNEPYSLGKTLPPESLDLDGLYRRVGTAIRAVNRNALLFFEDTQDSLTGRFGVTHPPEFRSVVYSFHLYRRDWDPLGLQVTRDFLARADRWKVPLWIGESNLFNGMVNANPPSGWTGSALAMLAYDKAHGIGWAVWAYAGPSSVVSPGTTDPKPEVLSVLRQGL